jgi:hypothetical protein
MQTFRTIQVSRAYMSSTPNSDYEVPPYTHPRNSRTCDTGLTIFPLNMDIVGVDKHTLSGEPCCDQRIRKYSNGGRLIREPRTRTL